MGTATSREIPAGATVLVLPLGSFEQHGPHLPLDTDSVIARAVVDDALSRGEVAASAFTVAPVLPVTASDEHAGFPGTLSMGTEATAAAIVAICRSATWARGVCIVNGHGGNADALARVASALHHEGIAHVVWTLPHYAGGDMHAGRTETSLMLHLAPGSVRTSLVPTDPVPLPDDAMATMRTDGVAAVSRTGVLGDASTATADHGRAVLELYGASLARTLARCLTDWSTP